MSLDGILRLHSKEFKVTLLSRPEPVRRPELCMLVGLSPVTEFAVGLPGRGVVSGFMVPLEPKRSSQGRVLLAWLPTAGRLTHSFLKRPGCIKCLLYQRAHY